MSRILTVAKYLPAVLSGLLVVAWVVSWFFLADTNLPTLGLTVGQGRFVLRCVRSDLIAQYHNDPFESFDCDFFPTTYPWAIEDLTGEFDYWVISRGSMIHTSLPIPFMLTTLLPLAIGPFIRFRFPLWSWFAFTALVAVELAYYLR